jgi:hypothetical protein
VCGRCGSFCSLAPRHVNVRAPPGVSTHATSKGSTKLAELRCQTCKQRQHYLACSPELAIWSPSAHSPLHILHGITMNRSHTGQTWSQQASCQTQCELNLFLEIGRYAWSLNKREKLMRCWLSVVWSPQPQHHRRSKLGRLSSTISRLGQRCWLPCFRAPRQAPANAII